MKIRSKLHEVYNTWRKIRVIQSKSFQENTNIKVKAHPQVKKVSSSVWNICWFDDLSFLYNCISSIITIWDYDLLLPLAIIKQFLIALSVQTVIYSIMKTWTLKWQEIFVLFKSIKCRSILLSHVNIIKYMKIYSIGMYFRVTFLRECELSSCWQ